MLSVIRAYPSLLGAERGKGRKEEERKMADSLTSVEHTISVIAGMHMAQAYVGGLWEENGLEGLCRIERTQE